MKLLRIPKFPRLKLQIPRRTPAPKKLQARMRTADAPVPDAYDDDEPQTKLTSAFIVVLILHVVAVGGIYAFNQIKASRRSGEASSSVPAPITPAKESKEPLRKLATTAEPVRSTQPEVPPTHVAAPNALVAPISKQRVYNVKPGDNLLGIAKAFGVSAADLKAANGLSSDIIHPGQVLNLPGVKAAPEAPSLSATKSSDTGEGKPAAKTYTVKGGDRLVFIAKKFGVTQEDLIALNKVKDPSKLQIGQTLKIPARKGN
jgi:LysM repeat protein